MRRMAERMEESRRQARETYAAKMRRARRMAEMVLRSIDSRLADTEAGARRDWAHVGDATRLIETLNEAGFALGLILDQRNAMSQKEDGR